MIMENLTANSKTQNLNVMIQQWTSSQFSQSLKKSMKNQLKEQCYLIY